MRFVLMAAAAAVLAACSTFPQEKVMAADTKPVSAPTAAEAPLAFTIFMLVKTTPTWLELRPQERFAFLQNDIEPILKEYPTVKMRFYESEAFISDVTDIAVWETADLGAYQSVVEELRESKFWSAYFDVVSILPAIENAYLRHYDVAPIGGGR